MKILLVLVLSCLCVFATESPAADDAPPKTLAENPGGDVFTFNVIGDKTHKDSTLPRVYLKCGAAAMRLSPVKHKAAAQNSVVSSPRLDGSQTDAKPTADAMIHQWFVSVDIRRVIPCWFVAEVKRSDGQLGEQIKMGPKAQSDLDTVWNIQSVSSGQITVARGSVSPLMLPTGRYHLVLDTAAHVVNIFPLHRERSLPKNAATDDAKGEGVADEKNDVYIVDALRRRKSGKVRRNVRVNGGDSVDGNGEDEDDWCDDDCDDEDDSQCLECRRHNHWLRDFVSKQKLLQKRKTWAKEDVAVLQQKYERVKSLVTRHENAAQHFKTRQLWITIPTIILGVLAVAFTLIFVRDDKSGISPLAKSIVLALKLSLMTGMQMVSHNFNYAATAEAHMHLSKAYKGVAFRLRSAVELPPTHLSVREFAKGINDEISEILKKFDGIETLIPPEIEMEWNNPVIEELVEMSESKPQGDEEAMANLLQPSWESQRIRVKKKRPKRDSSSESSSFFSDHSSEERERQRQIHKLQHRDAVP